MSLASGSFHNDSYIQLLPRGITDMTSAQIAKQIRSFNTPKDLESYETKIWIVCKSTWKTAMSIDNLSTGYSTEAYRRTLEQRTVLSTTSNSHGKH